MASASGSALRANRWFLLVLSLALIVRVFYLVYYSGMPDWNQLTVDNYYHHHWAQSIAGGNIFGDTTYFRAPFYVFCLALLYTLFGTSLWVGRLFGLAVGLGSVAVTYFTGKKIFDAKTGLIAAFLQSVYPVMFYFEGELLLDPLFTLLLQLSVYKLIVWLETKTTRDALMAGLMFGMASITRPTALVFVPIIVLLAATTVRKARLWAKHSILFVLGATIVIAPIFIRNLAVADDPVLIASQGGINLYIGNNSKADGVSAVLPEPLGHNWRLKDISYLAERDNGRKLKPGGVSSYWRNKAFQWIKIHPVDFVKLYATKLYRNFSNREISNNRDLRSFFSGVSILKYNPLSFGLLFLLSVVSIIAGFKHHSYIRILLLIILVYTLATSLFFFNSRFRLPLLPYYFLLAASGFFYLVRQFRSKQRASVPLMLGAIGAALFSFYPLVPLPQGSSPLPLISKGLYYYANGDFRQAIHYSTLALSIDSTFPETNLNIGACYVKLSLIDSAYYYFEREKRFNPGRAKVYANIASLYLVSGQYAAAIDEAAQALARKPYDVTASMVFLRAASKLPEVDNDSLAYLAYGASARTDHDIYLLNDAAGLLLSRGSPSLAEPLLLQALSSKPPLVETDDEAFAPTFRNSFPNWEKKRARTNYLLGYIYGLQGHYRKAIDRSSLAIKGDSSLAEAYVNLANGYLSLGEWQQAESVLKVALGKFPTNMSLNHLQNYLRK